MGPAAREQAVGARGSLTPERILAEAARIFNQRGYHGTTLEGVARALGVTKAALYYHVRSKEELLFRCHQVLVEIALEGVRSARECASSADEQLRLALTSYIEGILDHLRGSVVLLEHGALTPAHQRQVIAGRDEYERQLREIIAGGVRDGVFVPCDPRLVGFALLGAGNWIPKWYSPSGTRAPKEIAETFAAYLVRGLQCHPSADAIAPLSESQAGA
jgi:TetR/AcrR family transcriptional regulator